MIRLNKACLFFLLLILMDGACLYALPDSKDPRAWYERSAEDFEAAGFLHREGKFEGSVCFHAHQAIEKSLKGTLIAEGISPERNHDTENFARQLSKFYPGIKSFERDLSWIDGLYIPSRYPKVGVSAIRGEEAGRCLELARSILEWTQTKAVRS
ncbi:MAG: HEPN domain-containing protein [Candidatus Omnitrophica bacterium]|nr:HEPN domain-containing protein [Candidatus Omnitrophota bacterium]